MRKRTTLIASPQARLVTAIVCVGTALQAWGAEANEQVRERLCPCVWYQSERCQCTAKGSNPGPENPDGSPKACACEGCSHGSECECVAALQKGTGTIQGSVKSRRVRRTPAIVYIDHADRYVCKDHPQVASATAGKCGECGAKFIQGLYALPPENPRIEQHNLVFVPHVLPVLVGSTVDFPNTDTVNHNVFAPPKCAKQFNLGTYAKGVVKHVTFDNVGDVPLLCNVHAEMSAYVLVLENPYFATTDKRGEFVIKNVPAGKYRLKLWHEKIKSKTLEVTVEAGKVAEAAF